ncbi:MAG: HPF/RaiA family ribosome-associated protein [Myxococcaceae bacterium]|nr:HPF/RaiA family ribosome-associated protein [Myxococcaceae bacterium]MCI0672874.1 HPF/RaiA family ribosome-associated protein [Myxococcaceae bacterium]
MKLLLRGVHLGLNDNLKDYVQSHMVDHIARFYDDTAAELEVSLADVNGPKGGKDKEARVTFRSPHLATIHVTELGVDIYACVDLARDRLERLVKRELSRLRDVDHREVTDRESLRSTGPAPAMPEGMPTVGRG